MQENFQARGAGDSGCNQELANDSTLAAPRTPNIFQLYVPGVPLRSALGFTPHPLRRFKRCFAGHTSKIPFVVFNTIGLQELYEFVSKRDLRVMLFLSPNVQPHLLYL